MKITKDSIKDALCGAKSKMILIGRRVGAKNMIILCAVFVCAVAVTLNFIISGISGGEDEETNNPSGYVIDSSYYASLLSADDTDEALASSDSDDAGEAASRDEYFETAAYNRDVARDEAIQVLATVAESESAVQEVKDQASADIAALAAEITAEAKIEEMVKAKGFEDCVAIISGDVASVIVKSDGLLASEIAQITEIVYQQAGILPTNLNIVEK
ncbi:MAG: SpoIIIAH-like family protein [Firmicutes bacterium]|nr:SpoIIIAH-like family protein [Bacillota bacterium]MCD8315773.1 SpoIIIAH-like family protein [Bacillota bacterium]